jgi:hypothetical protein
LNWGQTGGKARVRRAAEKYASIEKVATIPSVAKLEGEIQDILMANEISAAHRLRSRPADNEEAHEGEVNGFSGSEGSGASSSEVPGSEASSNEVSMEKELGDLDDSLINFDGAGYSE